MDKSALLHLQARASVLALAETDPERRERRNDDAHDLLTLVESLLEDAGMGLISDPAAADLAFAKSHLGLLEV